jgi:hypothetical protein
MGPSFNSALFLVAMVLWVITEVSLRVVRGRSRRAAHKSLPDQGSRQDVDVALPIERRSHQRYPGASDLRYKLLSSQGFMREGLGILTASRRRPLKAPLCERIQTFIEFAEARPACEGAYSCSSIRQTSPEITSRKEIYDQLSIFSRISKHTRNSQTA